MILIPYHVIASLSGGLYSVFVPYLVVASWSGGLYSVIVPYLVVASWSGGPAVPALAPSQASRWLPPCSYAAALVAVSPYRIAASSDLRTRTQTNLVQQSEAPLLVPFKIIRPNFKTIQINTSLWIFEGCFKF